MSQTHYLLPTNRRKRFKLLQVPAFVLMGHRMEAVVEVERKRARWQRSYSTWRRLRVVIDHLDPQRRSDGVWLDVWWDDQKPVLHMGGR